MFKQNPLRQKQTAKLKACLIVFCMALFPPGAFSDDYVYLSDQVSIPLREGPAVDDKILKRKIVSGTKLRLLESKSEGNYIKVQTSKGEIGWLSAEYVVSEPPARLVLAEQFEMTAQLRSQLDAATKKSEKSAERLINLESQKSEMEAKTAVLENELQRIKFLAAQTMEINQNNLILEQTNKRLRESIKEMTVRNQASSKEKRYLDFLIGGALIFAGILVGALIKSRRRNSGWSG